MGYSVYYNGEIDISPKLSEEHVRVLGEALKNRRRSTGNHC